MIRLTRKCTRQVDLLRFVVGGAPPGTVVECPHFETDEERQAIRDRMSPSQQRRASGGSRGGNRGRCVDHETAIPSFVSFTALNLGKTVQ
jgi:hypothetical protein